MLLKTLWLSSALSLAALGWESPGLAAAAAGPQTPVPVFATAVEMAQKIDPDRAPLLQVNEALSPGDSVLQDGSFYDSYPFNGTAGQTITIRLESLEFDTYLLLLDPAGNVLAENDDTDVNDRNATIQYTLATSGTYTVIANAYDASGQGQYQLTVYAVEGSSSPAPTSANQLFETGVLLWRQGSLRSALDPLRQALGVFQAEGDTLGVAKIHHALGVVNHDLGAYEEALQHLETSLALFQSLGDSAGEADAINGLGLVAQSQGRYTEAETYLQAALALHRDAEDVAGAATALQSLGATAAAQGDYAAAIAYTEQSLALRRELGDPLDIARNLNNLAVIRNYQGRYDQALALYQEALTTIAPLGNADLESTTLTNIGVIYSYRGRYPEALDYHQRALTLAQEIGDRDTEGTALNNLGLTYNLMGQYERAQTSFEKALAIARDIGDRAGEGVLLGNLASVIDDLGNKTQAIALLESSLRIRQALGDRAGQSEVLNNLGTVYDDLGDYGTALKHYEASLAISRELGNRYVEGRTLSNLGVTFSKQQQYDRALSQFEQALALFAQTGDKVGEANALRRIAEIQYKLGRLSEAEATLTNTINRLEALRAGDLTDAERVALFDTQRAAYMTYQEVLVAQQDIAGALEISEQGRARAFAERLAASDRATAAAPTTEIAAPTLAEIIAIARSQQATLVQYSLIQPTPEDPAQLFIWVVQPTGDLFFHAQPLAAGASQANNDLVALVNQQRGAVGAGSRGLAAVAVNAASRGNNSYQALYNQLIAPIADYLPTDPSDRVVFIPQDELFQVPFPALQRPDGRYLIEQHTILTAPSIQVLGLTQAIAQTSPSDLSGNALIVGNPDMPSLYSPEQNRSQALPPLPGAQQEAIEIASLLATEPLIGAAATEAQVKQTISTAPLVHLATHGLLEYGRVEDSGVRDLPGAIALAPGDGEDGLLTAAEILELPLAADLVVLSACDTGRGRITGDGVVGLSRSLMIAGVPSVIVSLWAVPDAPTATLMTEFYRQLAQTPDKAQALRQAMLITAQQHPNPRDWAAFTLLGSAD